MQIEFQNCSLEMGYIGTPDQIMIAMIRDACQVAADAIIDFARWGIAVLAEAFERIAEMMRAWLVGGRGEARMSDYQEGDNVAYIPYHARGQINHPDVEYGEVTGKNNSYIFVKFKGDNFSKAVIRERLHRVA